MSIFNLRTDRIPEHLREILQAIQLLLGEEAYDFLLIGATARDLILDGINDLGVGRKTLDVDFAIYVPEWRNYEGIIDKLLSSGMFSATEVKHRLIYKHAYEVDIVPFGDIQDDKGEYAWPPDFMMSMNVAGFVEINNNGIEINTDGNLRFKVAPIEGICVMKIFAWKDRKYRMDKDGRDLGFILSNYVDLKYEVLYDKYADIIQSDDWDNIISGARILGRDMAEVIAGNEYALSHLKKILTEELEDEDNSLLAKVMCDGQSFNYQKSIRALAEMLRGLADGSRLS